MKNEKGGGHQRKRSAQKHRKSSSGSRKGKTTRSLTLAEKSGLEGRDVVVMADVGRLAAPHPLLDLLDLQFSLWSAALRLSPIGHMVRQQAVVTRGFFDLWLRESGTQDKRSSRRKRGG
jgi:hypothetical protein